MGFIPLSRDSVIFLVRIDRKVILANLEVDLEIYSNGRRDVCTLFLIVFEETTLHAVRSGI